MDNYIPIREAVNLTGMCAQTLRKLCDNNEIEYFKTLSGQRKISKKSLEELTRSNENNINLTSRATKNAEKCSNKNIFYINENVENIDEIKELIKKKNLFNNYQIIHEKCGIKKLAEYCLFNSKNNYNIILIDNNIKDFYAKEYDFIKYLVEISKSNIIEINLT
jgi:hypothetical protein